MNTTAARLREWVSRLVGTFRRGRSDAELEQELRVHLELAAEAQKAHGGAAPTGRAAMLRGDGVPQVMEAIRDQRGLPWLEQLFRDVRHARRALRRSAAFTTASVLSVALGIGATTAVFAVVRTVVINPLPYPDSDRIVRLDHKVPRVNAPSLDRVPLGIYYLYADRARTLDAVALYRSDAVTITGSEGDAERLPATRATGALADVLRVRPALGRWIRDGESAPGGAPVAVLSHGLWVRRYRGDAGILGQSITVSGVPTTVVGVMPASFTFADPRTELWLAEPITRASGFGIFVYTVAARMRNGVTVEDVRRELDGLIAQLPQVYPASLAESLAEEGFASRAATLKDVTIGDSATGLWILLAAASVLLVVAFVNVANLALVHAELRQREVAIRRALGAGRLGILRGFGAEAALVAGAGTVAAVLLGWIAVSALQWMNPASVPRVAEIRLDAGVFAFAGGLGLLAAILLTLIPMLNATSAPSGLREAGRGQMASGQRQYARRLLMGAQIALALVLVVASGLMLRTFQALRTVDPGFDARSTVTFRIGLPERQYTTREAAAAAHRDILDQLRTLPGLANVSAVSCLPLTPSWTSQCFGNTLVVEQGADARRSRQLPVAFLNAVAPDYFDTMRLPLLRGRMLTAAEIERGEPNVLIDNALADAYFPGADPLGQHIASNRPITQGRPMPLTIVGIVGNTLTASLTEPKPTPKLYMPMTIAGGPDIRREALVGANIAAMTYVVRTQRQPSAVLAAIRDRVRRFDPGVALADVQTLERRVAEASQSTIFTLWLLGTAAAVTLILGMIGVYGVMSYIVSRRRGEIGVRLALGAQARGVARMIVGQGGQVLVLGLAAGLIAALASGRFVESLLFGVTSRDSTVFVSATLLLGVVSLVACWLPARRAARLDPTVALRSE